MTIFVDSFAEFDILVASRREPIMRTFTFITYMNADETAEATVALRGELHGSNMVGITPLRPRTTRHLDRFVSGRNWHITGICQIDCDDLRTAASIMGIDFKRYEGIGF